MDGIATKCNKLQQSANATQQSGEREERAYISNTQSHNLLLIELGKE